MIKLVVCTSSGCMHLHILLSLGFAVVVSLPKNILCGDYEIDMKCVLVQWLIYTIVC